MKFKVGETELDTDEIPELQEYIEEQKTQAAQAASLGAIKSNERQWAASVANLIGDESIRTLTAKEVKARLNEYVEESKTTSKTVPEDLIKKERGKLEAELQNERLKMRTELQKEQAIERIQSKLIAAGLNESLQGNKSAIEALLQKHYKIDSDGESVYFRDPKTEADIFDPKSNAPASWEFVAEKFREQNPGLFTTAPKAGGSTPTAPAVHAQGKNWMDIDTDQLLNA